MVQSPFQLECQEVPADADADIWSRIDLRIVQRDSIPCLKSYSPALGLDSHLDLFGDVFSLLVDLDAVELRTIAGDPGSVARV